MRVNATVILPESWICSMSGLPTSMCSPCVMPNPNPTSHNASWESQMVTFRPQKMIFQAWFCSSAFWRRSCATSCRRYLECNWTWHLQYQNIAVRCQLAAWCMVPRCAKMCQDAPRCAKMCQGTGSALFRLLPSFGVSVQPRNPQRQLMLNHPPWRHPSSALQVPSLRWPGFRVLFGLMWCGLKSGWIWECFDIGFYGWCQKQVAPQPTENDGLLLQNKDENWRSIWSGCQKAMAINYWWFASAPNVSFVTHFGWFT